MAIVMNKLNTGALTIARRTSTRVWYGDDESVYTDFEISGAIVRDPESQITDVESAKKIDVGSAVTSIGEEAFIDCTSLESITIGSNVTSIDYRGFSNCVNLTGITIPDSVTSIGERAFESCERMTSVTIGSGVTSIGEDAFYQCTSVTDVYCHPNPENLMWNESECDDFAGDGSTVCHVKAEYLSAYQSKFDGVVNVTFVGDLI